MDPEKLKWLSEAHRRGLLQGEDRLWFEEYLKRQTGGRSGTAGQVMESLLQGATLGFSDEMQAGAEAGVDVLKSGAGALWDAATTNQSLSDAYDKRMGGEGVGDKYSRYKDQINNYYKPYQKEHPYLDMAGQIAGSIPTAALGAAGNLRNLSTAGKIYQGAKTGAAYGAVSGVGHAESDKEGLEYLKDMAQAGQTGATTGAIFGGALPAAGAAISKGKDAVQGLSSRSAGTVADRKIMQALERDGMSLDQVAHKADRMGDKGNILSAGGANIESLGRVASAIPSRARTQAENTMRSTLTGRNSRLKSIIDSKLTRGGTYYDTDDLLRSVRSDKANDLFNEAFRHVLPIDKEFKKLLQRPSAQKAWEHAKVLAADEGQTLPDNIFYATSHGVTRDVIDTKVFHYLKKGFDDYLSTFYDDFGRISKKGNEVKIKQDLLGRLRDKAVAANPAYGRALSEFSSDSANLKALNLGFNFLKSPSAISRKHLKRMSNSERQMFKVGAGNAIMEKIKQSPDAHNIVNKIFKDESTRDKLKAAFGNTKDFNEFKRQVLIEARFQRKGQKVFGGSVTARLQGEADDFSVDPNAVLGTVSNALQNRPIAAIASAARGMTDKFRAPNEKVINQLMPILMEQNPVKRRMMIDQIQARMPNMSTELKDWLERAAGIAGAVNINSQIQQNNQQLLDQRPMGLLGGY